MNAFALASRFLGVVEIKGGVHHPVIQWGFTLCDGYGPDTPDEVPWCSAFAQIPAFLAGLERSRSAAARSWLSVGDTVALDAAVPGDIVVFARGTGWQGHVGYYAGRTPDGGIVTLGGNQNDRVSLATYGADRLLGVRRLGPE